MNGDILSKVQTQDGLHKEFVKALIVYIKIHLRRAFINHRLLIVIHHISASNPRALCAASCHGNGQKEESTDEIPKPTYRTFIRLMLAISLFPFQYVLKLTSQRKEEPQNGFFKPYELKISVRD